MDNIIQTVVFDIDKLETSLHEWWDKHFGHTVNDPRQANTAGYARLIAAWHELHVNLISKAREQAFEFPESNDNDVAPTPTPENTLTIDIPVEPTADLTHVSTETEDQAAQIPV